MVFYKRCPHNLRLVSQIIYKWLINFAWKPVGRVFSSFQSFQVYYLKTVLTVSVMSMLNLVIAKSKFRIIIRVYFAENNISVASLLESGLNDIFHC